MNKEKENLEAIANVLVATRHELVAEANRAVTLLSQERWARTVALTQLANALHIQLPREIANAEDSAVISYIASKVANESTYVGRGKGDGNQP